MGSDLMINPTLRTSDRCSYLGASDARTMLGKDEKALFRLWQEKRGEIEPEDLSGNLLVLFGCATEELNRRWFDRETGHSIGAVQRFLRHPKLEWMGATVDGIVPDDGAVFEAKFMLPWNFAEDVAADKHMAQLQHNMLVTGARRTYLSLLTGYCRFAFSRTPGPPPFWGMNSMPAASRARSIAAITVLFTGGSAYATRHRWSAISAQAVRGRARPSGQLLAPFGAARLMINRLNVDRGYRCRRGAAG